MIDSSHFKFFSFAINLRCNNTIFRKEDCKTKEHSRVLYLTLSKSRNASFISRIKSIEMFLSLTNETNSLFSLSLRSGISSPSINFPVFLFFECCSSSLSVGFVPQKYASSLWTPFVSFTSLLVEICSSS